METLSHKDLLALNLAIGEIYAARDMESFYSSVFRFFKETIGSELCSCADADLSPARFLKLTTNSPEHDRVSSILLPAFNAHLTGHPLFPEAFTGNVVRTTDYASTSQFLATEIHNEYYRYLDVETQICFSIQVSQGKVALFALSRKGSEYSERDRLMLTLLKPHLSGALRNIKELGQLRLEKDPLLKGTLAQRQGVVLFRRDGTVIAISEPATEMFGRYFAAALAEGDLIPADLAQWIETESCLTHLARQVERAPFVVERDGKRLTIELRHDVITGDRLLVCTESDPAAKMRRLHHYALSSRQIETLLWLAKGKTNAEIAVILNISKRTVEKHLEHIFDKLGVETRAAALAIVQKCDIN